VALENSKNVNLDRSNWQSICEYWDEETYGLKTDVKEPVNDFLFDLL